MSYKRALTAFIILFGLLIGLCTAASQPVEKAGAVTDKSPLISTQTLIDKVPAEIYRRAANLLEELRYDQSEPSWKEGKLSPSVNIFYRPDVQGIAYYEFEVNPSGFIILSLGEYDVPVPQYSSTGSSMGNLLKSKAKSVGKTAAKFYKLDSLSFVAEDAQGELASSVGEMPLKVSGIDPAWAKEGIQESAVILNPTEESDDKVVSAGRKVERSGPESYPIKLQSWQSWKELKEGYASNYRVLLDAMHEDAAEEWSVQNRLKDSGEGLFPGDHYTLAFLYPDADYDVSGPGKEFISYNATKRKGLPDALDIYAHKVPPNGKAEFVVSINYGSGAKESIKFAVIDPSKVKRQEDDDTKTQLVTGTIATVPEMQKLRVQVTWRPWETWWAGTDNAQRMYYQFPYDGCAVGCGPVAWAMLFGWADHQSWIDSPDWNRGGIYRENGGYGSDVDAPRNMDDGIRNMIREISDDVETWCTPSDAGATNPWDMGEAWRYLDGRTGAGFRAEWNLIPTNGLRNRARDSIRDRDTPAVIGTGVLEHYPLAYGYRYRESRWGYLHQRQFYVNQGWGGTGNCWVDARTWFAGEIFN